MAGAGCLIASRLDSERLVLDPLRPDHAAELAPVLDDVSLHGFIGGEPLGAEALQARFERQAVGHSPDGSERWLNWVVRERSSAQAVGTLQATVRQCDDGAVAELAWVVGVLAQGRGYAKEAAGLVASWLREQGVRCLRAHIHPDHRASIAVARSLGMRQTDVVKDGELRWESTPQQSGEGGIRTLERG